MQDNKAKTAIVVGATGLIGSAVVDRLAVSEHISKVVTLTRRGASHSSAKVVNHVVDFENLQVASLLESADILFSCMGTTLKQAGSVEAQRKIDLDYQYAIAELAANSGVEHYLLVSSSGANEQSSSAYLKMKGELEQKAKLLPFARISIFQPSLLIGERSDFRFGEKLGSLLMPALCMVPMLRRYRPIHGNQVADKMVEVSQTAKEGIEYFVLDQIF